MIIRHAKIDNYGKLQNREFVFSPGINVIYGENEAGKSTLQSFLKSMLFGLEKTRRRNAPDEYSRYEPWDAPAWFAGELEFSVEEKDFLLSRNFYRKEPVSRLVNLQDGEELSVEHGDLEMLLGGVGREAFEHTLAVSGTGNYPGEMLSRLVQDEMQNMAQTGDGSFRLSRGLAYLEQKKRELGRRERELRNERAQTMERLSEQDRAVSERLEGLQERIRDLAAAREAQEAERRPENFRDFRDAEARTDARIGHEEEDGGTDFQRSDEEEWTGEYEQERQGARNWDPLVLIGIIGFFVTALVFEQHRLAGRPAAMLLILFGVLITAGLIRLMVRRRRAQDGDFDPDPEDEYDWEEERREAELTHRIMLARNDGEQEAITDQIREYQTERSNLQEALAEAEQRSAEELQIAQSLKALDLAASVMEQQARTGSSRMKGELERRTSEILEQMTAGRYARTQAGAGGDPVVSDDRREISVAALSSGTADQVWFAWRMAAGELLCREEPLPFLLDEVFASYDDRRLSETIGWLASQRHQIFLFCCQHREEKMLEQLGIPFRLIRL